MKLQELGVLIVLLLEVAIFAAVCPEVADHQTGQAHSTFLSANNLLKVGRGISFIGIAAIGATLVIVGGGIDLSVGSIIGLSGVVMGTVIDAHRVSTDVAAFEPGWLLIGLLAGLAAGCAAGCINGILVVGVRLPPFIATLGMLSIVRGLAFAITEGQNITQIIPKGSFADVLGYGTVSATVTILPIVVALMVAVIPGRGGRGVQEAKRHWGRWIPFGCSVMLLSALIVSRGRLPAIPTPMVVLLWATLAGTVFLSQTKYGRAIYALGGNEEATRLSGLSPGRVKMLMYGIAGLAAGLAGVLYSCRFGYASSTAGRGYELSVIAAVVIGGTSLTGGRGSVAGSLLGAAIMGVLTNGLTLLSIPEQFVELAIGTVIVLAVALDVWKSNLSLGRLLWRS